MKQKTVKELHDVAMGIVSDILIGPHINKADVDDKLFRVALKLETEAADKVPKKKESEPSRSILYRSAATIAYRCREYAEAKRLIAEGLSGWPPPEIEKELKDLEKMIEGVV